MIDKFIEKRKDCSRWVTNEEVNKIKTINERVFIESFIGRVLVFINYFLCMKLVHTNGENFWPQYSTNSYKYIVILTWVVFTLMVLVSVFQLITKNKVYISDTTLSDEEIEYYKYKLFNRTARLGFLVIFYIIIYQVIFQLTIKGINIKLSIVWWIIAFNLLGAIYLSFINSKNYIKRKIVKKAVQKSLHEINNENYGEAKRIVENYMEENEGLISSDLIITFRAIEEVIQCAEKENYKSSKSELVKTDLIANVSHDLKTPLTSIINYTHFLKTKELSESKRCEYIEIIDKKSKRLKTLIEDLKESTNANDDKVKLEIKEVSLVQILNEALSEVNERFREKQLEINLIIGENNEEIKNNLIDVNKMMRVFHNLLSNILKYAKENTIVTIKLDQEESVDFDKGYYTRLIFKNISKEELKMNGEEVIERFKRGDQSRNTEGSGLGLDIAKSLIELQGGQMVVSIDNEVFMIDIII